MRDFFRGWKRKLGCFTLMMACLFAAAWVRSTSVSEQLWFRSSKSTICLIATSDQAVTCILCSYTHPTHATPFHYRRLDPGVMCSFPAGGNITASKMIPYWWIVVPLTMISAWLLLSNPQTELEWPIAPASENS